MLVLHALQQSEMPLVGPRKQPSDALQPKPSIG